MSQPTDLFDPAARWAAPDPEPIIGDDLRGLLRQAFAIEEDGGAVSPAAVVLAVAASRLTPAIAEALQAIVGTDHVLFDQAARAAHAYCAPVLVPA